MIHSAGHSPEFWVNDQVPNLLKVLQVTTLQCNEARIELESPNFASKPEQPGLSSSIRLEVVYIQTQTFV